MWVEWSVNVVQTTVAWGPYNRWASPQKQRLGPCPKAGCICPSGPTCCFLLDSLSPGAEDQGLEARGGFPASSEP